MTQRRRDVAFYAPWAGPNLTASEAPSGGAEVQVLHLARGLAARDRDVAVITQAVPGLPSTVDGVEIVAQPRPQLRPTILRRIALLATTAYVLLRTSAHAVVQRSSGATTGLVGLATTLTRTRFVFSSASTVDFSFEDLGHNRATNALYHLGVRLADAIVVQTDEQAVLCRKRFGREPVVIRSVAEPADGPRDSARSQGFLWIGRLTSYKNPEAYLDLAAAVPEAPFTMVCVPADEAGAAVLAKLEVRAASIPNLTLLGPQSRPAILERIADATAVVSTSVFEGMPNTLIEGWARGIPSLTLSHDPDGVIEREGLGTCAAGDAELLAAKARELWADRASGGPLRTHCRDYARRVHHPDAVLAQWEQVLRVL